MPDMTTNQRTGCMSAIFAAWMLFFGVGLIVTALFNHGVVGWSPLYNGINSVGISFLLFCFYKFHYPRLVKRDTSDFKIVADFETAGRADIAAMYLRSHDIFAVVTNTGDAALPGLTTARGIYIKVPLDQEQHAIELLDAEPEN